MSSFYSYSPLKIPPSCGSSWVWVALIACLLLMVFILEMNTVIFLAAFIKTRLLKSSSALLINFFNAVSPLQFFCDSFFFIFLNQERQEGTCGCPAMPFRVKASRRRIECFSYLIVRVKRSKNSLGISYKILKPVQEALQRLQISMFCEKWDQL